MKSINIEDLWGCYYPGNKGTVIMLHGLLSSHLEFFDYPERINAYGYGVLVLDFEGHGKSRGKRGYENIEKNIEVLKRWIKYLKKSGNLKKPLILLGHSLGAATVIYALAERIGDIGIAIAPPSSIKEELGVGERIFLPLIHIFGRIWEIITGKSFYLKYRVNYEILYTDKKMAEKAKRMGFLDDKLWIGSYKPLMSVDTVSQARKVKRPCMIVIPTEDKVVNPQNARKVYDALNGPKFLYLARSYGHSVMGEDSGEILSAIIGYIEKQRNK